MSNWEVIDAPVVLENHDGEGPIVVHAHNVFDRRQHRAFRGQPGLSLRQLAPKTGLATLCTYNGDFVLPEDLDWIPSKNDHVAFCTLPKGGGNASTQILGVLLIIVGALTSWAGGGYLIVAGVALLAVGLLPTPNVSAISDTSAATAPSPTYNVQAGGNSARIGQAIPVIYGRHLVTPDFASQPYSRFTNDDDQLYHVLFCLGQMDKFTLESILLDDTDLSHFKDVDWELIGPNYPATTVVDPFSFVTIIVPSIVNPGVVNAIEVSYNNMVFGTYIGPFVSSGPGLNAYAVEIDIVCPKGLWHAEDDGSFSEKTATWIVEGRKVTNKGAVAGDWFLIGFESLTGATNKEIRRSYSYAYDTPGRYEVRVQRQEAEDDNARSGHALQWAGMKAYLDIPAPIEPSATFLAIRMRANSQLSGLAQRRFSVIIRRWLPTWNPDTGWSAPVYTRSIAWVAADVLRNADYGGGMVDSRIDLQTLYELDLVWTSRGDTFNGVFDKRVTMWAALTTVLRAGRARPIMRGSVVTFVRDAQQDLPVALFSMRNIQRGSFKFEYTMLDDDSADGVELQFFNEETWSTDYARIPAPGVELVDMVSPANVSILGITNRNQALREAAFIVANGAYRKSGIEFVTENEGYLPSYGDLVAVSHDVAGWGVSGDIEAFDGSIATTTEELTWTVGNHYAVLIDAKGDVKGPYLVTSGTAPRTMQFLELPPVGTIYTGTERERTRYAMGPANEYSKLCRITSLIPKANGTIAIKALIEDNRVHTADEPCFTGPIGDDGTRIAHYTPDDIPVYDTTSDAQRAIYGFFCDEDLTIGITDDEAYIYDA